jgi:hypothetical protein
MALLSVLVLFATLQAPDQSPTSVRVYVFTMTAPTGERSDDEKERLAAVTDMREALGHKKGLTVVDNLEQSNVQMEVLGREQREEPTGSFGGKSITRMGDTIIRLRVRSGEDESDLKGMGQGTYSRAAKDAADRFMKWIARREPKR